MLSGRGYAVNRLSVFSHDDQKFVTNSGANGPAGTEHGRALRRSFDLVDGSNIIADRRSGHAWLQSRRPLTATAQPRTIQDDLVDHFLLCGPESRA